MSIRLYTSSLSPPLNKPSDEELRQIEEFIASLEFKERESKEKVKTTPEIFYNHLKNFDPNKVLARELKEMGFPENVISNIFKYKKSGGRFFKPEEIKKIYGVTDSAFNKIAPYIIIIDSIREKRMLSGINVKKVKEKKIINLNKADSTHLVSLNGIGPSFALRIIKYRKRLGGFIVPEQLLEVYGMDSTRFNLFKGGIYIDTADIQKMNINNVSYSDLIKHPYMDEQTAASIIKFRDYKGGIRDIRELNLYNVIQNDKFKKIEPYLDISY